MAAWRIKIVPAFLVSASQNYIYLLTHAAETSSNCPHIPGPFPVTVPTSGTIYGGTLREFLWNLSVKPTGSAGIPRLRPGCVAPSPDASVCGRYEIT